MRTRNTLAALAIALFVGSCGHDPMDEGMGDMHAAMSSARAETLQHHEAALAATSMSDMMTELDRHEIALGGIMDRMDLTMGEMSSHCSGPGMMEMQSMMDGMRSQMAAHRAELEAVTALDDARTLCVAHTNAMDDMLDGMDGAFGHM